MKKVAITTAPAIILSMLLMINLPSCKKTEKPDLKLTPAKSDEPGPPMMGRFQDSVSVSSRGFLKFLSSDNLGDFLDFAQSRTHMAVQAYLDSLGVVTIGHGMYGKSLDPYIVSEAESYNYLFNTDQVFQVEDAILRPIDSIDADVKWQFFLVMSPSFLTNSSYANLAAGTFDANTMNKLATNSDNDFNLFDFLQGTPRGEEETTANAGTSARPMFGKKKGPQQTVCSGSYHHPITGNCTVRCKKQHQVTTYIFWIGFHSSEPVIDETYELTIGGECD